MVYNLGWRHEVVFTQRRNDVHVCIKGRPAVWGCGRSEQYALGDLILSHATIFGIRANRLNEDTDDRLAFMTDEPAMMDPTDIADADFRRDFWQPQYGETSSITTRK